MSNVRGLVSDDPIALLLITLVIKAIAYFFVIRIAIRWFRRPLGDVNSAPITSGTSWYTLPSGGSHGQLWQSGSFQNGMVAWAFWWGSRLAIAFGGYQPWAYRLPATVVELRRASRGKFFC
jgi:hypothetical protein